MRSLRAPSLLLAASLAACAPPGDLLTDGLEAPGDLPSGANPALPSTLFPNAPSGSGWIQIGQLSWTNSIPFRRDPVYEPPNELRVVNWGDDDPQHDWGRQAVLVGDVDVPGSSSSALELRLPAGLSGGYGSSKISQHPDAEGSGPLAWDPSLCTGHVYVGVYIRFSSGFTFNGNVGTKVLMLKSRLAPNRQLNHMIVGVMNDGTSGDELFPTYVPQYPFGRYQAPDQEGADLNDGLWHLVEMLQSPNAPGQSNGTLDMWIDGRSVGRWTNARFFDEGQVASVDLLEIAPIFGGGVSPVPRDQWMRLGPLDVRVR